VVHAERPEGNLQNENRNPAMPEPRESLTAQASRKLDLPGKILPPEDDRARFEDLREEDPERWDGMS
jgi:hypothetical protein